MSTVVPDFLWRKFARLTVQTGDLDPMYDLIYKGRMKYGGQWGYQFALHFFMYYHPGQAAAMANAKTELDFWHMQNHGYEEFKRGTERRHFRGEKGRIAMLTFQRMGSPKEIWQKLWSPTYTLMLDNIKAEFQGCQIGPYFAWKAMDILDRCLSLPVSLSLKEAMLGMPDEPRESAKYFFPDMNLGSVLDMIVEEICDMDAQGQPNRKCGYAEAETILCMMKGYFKTKTHTIGDDVDEKYNQLADHPYLRRLLPPKLDWDSYERAMESARLSAASAGVRTS